MLFGDGFDEDERDIGGLVMWSNSPSNPENGKNNNFSVSWCSWRMHLTAYATPRGKEWHTTQHNPKPSTPLPLSYSTLIVVATLFDLNFLIITQCNLPHQDTQTCTHNSPPIMKAIHHKWKNIPHCDSLPIMITAHHPINPEGDNYNCNCNHSILIRYLSMTGNIMKVKVNRDVLIITFWTGRDIIIVIVVVMVVRFPVVGFVASE